LKLGGKDMSIKHKLKQSTALLLSCLTVLNATPITSYAIGGNTSAGDASGIVGGVGSDMGVNRDPSRIGFRVSLVSKDDLSKVVSVTDSGEPTVDIKQGIFQQTALEYPLSYFWVYCPRDFRPSIPTLRVPAVKGLTGSLLHHLLHHFSILGRYITHLDEISKVGESL
jgi:hypothetical protein